MSKKYLNIILILIFVALASRFINISSFLSETDDQLPIAQLLKYDELNLYDLANDQSSATYESKSKKFLRNLENKENRLINFFQNTFSSVIFNMAPSKHSTFAPLQYFIFGWTIDKKLNYNQLKFYGRIPSVFFSFLTIFITFKICQRFIFKNDFSYLATFLIIFSFPLIYISQRSYNYSAAVFAITFLLYLFLNECDDNSKKTFLDERKFNFKLNFYFSILISLSSYLSYITLVILPSFFIFKFIINFIGYKKFFCIKNINLIFTGFLLSVLVTPLLIHMLSINLGDYGMTASTAGANWEYSIKTVDQNILSYIAFFSKNFYLIISKNISFFLDNNFYSTILQIALFVIFVFGLLFSFRSTNKNHSRFLLLFILILVNWVILVMLNITAFGPTRHLLIFAPITSIFFVIGFERLLDKLTLIKYVNKILYSTIILFTIIFTLNFISFSKLYKDSFDEDSLVDIIKRENVSLIINGSSHADVLCLMSSIKVKIASCPIRYSRYSNIYEFNDFDLKTIKENSQSIMIINYNLTSYLIEKLNEHSFNKSIEFKNHRYTGGSPLAISKYVPNYIEYYIYK